MPYDMKAVSSVGQSVSQSASQPKYFMTKRPREAQPTQCNLPEAPRGMQIVQCSFAVYHQSGNGTQVARLDSVFARLSDWRSHASTCCQALAPGPATHMCGPALVSSSSLPGRALPPSRMRDPSPAASLPRHLLAHMRVMHGRGNQKCNHKLLRRWLVSVLHKVPFPDPSSVSYA